MNKMVTNITKGMIAGIVVGTAVGMMGGRTRKGSVKKNAGRALSAAGSFIENMQNMVR
jgi:uncharacterized membrane protein